jgi:hypothetical protein
MNISFLLWKHSWRQTSGGKSLGVLGQTALFLRSSWCSGAVAFAVVSSRHNAFWAPSGEYHPGLRLESDTTIKIKLGRSIHLRQLSRASRHNYRSPGSWKSCSLPESFLRVAGCKSAVCFFGAFLSDLQSSVTKGSEPHGYINFHGVETRLVTSRIGSAFPFSFPAIFPRMPDHLCSLSGLVCPRPSRCTLLLPATDQALRNQSTASCARIQIWTNISFFSFGFHFSSM